MKYDYSDIRAQCALRGMAVDEAMIATADESFDAIGLTQDQVRTVMRVHLLAVCRLFSKKNYTLGQRILLALHFLFGKNFA